jgi:hypothetical protein
MQRHGSTQKGWGYENYFFKLRTPVEAPTVSCQEQRTTARTKNFLSISRHSASPKNERTMRFYELTIVSIAALTSQALAIQVECRQANIIRQNDEYFERAKKAVHPGAENIKPVEEVSHSYMGIDSNALVEHATTVLGK